MDIQTYDIIRQNIKLHNKHLQNKIHRQQPHRK